MFHYQLHNPSVLYKAQNQHTILKKYAGSPQIWT